MHDILSVNKSLAECFNVTHKVVMKWINQYDLPCRKFKCSCCTKYMIDLENFWKWAEQHRRYYQLVLCMIDKNIEALEPAVGKVKKSHMTDQTKENTGQIWK